MSQNELASARLLPLASFAKSVILEQPTQTADRQEPCALFRKPSNVLGCLHGQKIQVHFEDGVFKVGVRQYGLNTRTG